jgi:Contractile injection system tube protein
MTTFPGSPKLIKGGIVQFDTGSSQVKRVISLQINPETLNRSFQIQGIESGEGGDRSQALRLKGPPVESYKLEATIDATDLLELGDKDVAEFGIQRELNALEAIAYPTSEELRTNDRLAQSGMLEIIPMEAPLTLFIWSKVRVLPVRITELSITEKAFLPNLMPILATVSLGMRVLSIGDLGFDHKGGQLYMDYLQSKERLRDQYTSLGLNSLGIGEIR